jgi:hypothetical protein
MQTTNTKTTTFDNDTKDREEQLFRASNGIDTLRRMYLEETDPVRKDMLHNIIAESICI